MYIFKRSVWQVIRFDWKLIQTLLSHRLSLTKDVWRMPTTTQEALCVCVVFVCCAINVWSLNETLPSVHLDNSSLSRGVQMLGSCRGLYYLTRMLALWQSICLVFPCWERQEILTQCQNHRKTIHNWCWGSVPLLVRKVAKIGFHLSQLSCAQI